jgi:hypothetical protein
MRLVFESILLCLYIVQKNLLSTTMMSKATLRFQQLFDLTFNYFEGLRLCWAEHSFILVSFFSFLLMLQYFHTRIAFIHIERESYETIHQRMHLQLFLQSLLLIFFRCIVIKMEFI